MKTTTWFAQVSQFCLLVIVLASTACAQQAEDESSKPLDGEDGRPLELREFRPTPALSVRVTDLKHAKFPVVDSHTHFRYRLKHSPEQLDDFVDVMDRNNIAICVSLDGKMGAEFDDHAKYLWTKYPDRFVIYANIDWQGTGEKDKPETWACQRPEFGRMMSEELKRLKGKGISGLKIFKSFGLSYKNPDGSLIKIDDPRWDPIWAACGKLEIPIIIHTADPKAFFDPIDRFNERWEELSRHPDWSFHGDEFPSRKELLDARNRVIARHPKTIFIGAHFGNNPEDLETVEKWLAAYPNLYIEPSSRISELGRQPFTARKFMIKHADRILFGTDGPWPEERIRYYWRFMETFDEYFRYSEKIPPPQGLWNIYGTGLPDEVLQKIYYKNAATIIPGVAQRLEKYEPDFAK